MADQLVPLTQAPNQTFTVQLSVDGDPLTLNLQLSFSVMSGWWQLQIANVQNKVLIASVPLITGFYPASNILAQYAYLQIGSAYVLNTGNANTDSPSATNLPQFSLVWGDTAI